LIELFEFQRAASNTIAERFIEYVADPAIVGTKADHRRIPFFQSLASITASGKTAILADAVGTISAGLSVPPIVLWLSKGKVVVEQSYANLQAGGKYHHLLGDFEVRTLAEYGADEVREIERPFVFFATVGTFNVRDKELGNRLIYQSDIDNANRSTWDALKLRTTAHLQRRPLLVVYDEAHNLSNQQTDLLVELEPEGFLLASATMKLPDRFRSMVEDLQRSGKSDAWLVTTVDPRAVADAGLIKSTLILGGYKASMEEVISSLLADLQEADEDAATYGLEGRPKAIYVCNTNIVEGNAYQRDDPKQPFHVRQAPPIVIWRYLTGPGGVEPLDIAVYSSLQFHKDFPPPPHFVHFKGGDADYQRFAQGAYRHIIFNLSLQEGWDDPLCYFAYIDKSMESRVQVEQIVGRLLRQPEVRRFPAERLNAAEFYVRVDRGEVFDEVLREVRAKIAHDAPELKFISKATDKSPPRELKPKESLSVPSTAYNAHKAVAPIARLVDQLPDYRGGLGVNIEAHGGMTEVVMEVGKDAPDDKTETSWRSFGHSGQVSARWVFQREVRRRFQGALQVTSVADPKFDARVGVGSRAFKNISDIAARVVDEYLDYVYLEQKPVDGYEVGPILVRPETLVPYQHSLHEGYEGLNGFEEDFAKVLDKAAMTWCRNQPRSGYGIPLITIGTTSNFYPDFLVWVDHIVWAVDTKGGHVLPDALARKLLNIEPPTTSSQRLRVRFISLGTWTADLEQPDHAGYTVWGLKQDGTRRAIAVSNLDEALSLVLDPEL
jgi:type III restriction enzyme